MSLDGSRWFRQCLGLIDIGGSFSVSGGHLLTDKNKGDEKEVVDSKKLSERDKKQIQEGACVNCALISFIFIAISILAMVL